MKKLLLITKFFPPQIGGIEHYYFELCSALPPESIVVLADKLILQNNSGNAPKCNFSVKYENFDFKNKYIWPKWLKLLLLLPKIIKETQPTMLWAGEPLPTGTAVKIIAKFYNLPYMVSTHGADVLNPAKQASLAGLRRNYMLKNVLLGSFLVTANTEYTRLAVSKLGLEHDKSVVIYPGPTHKPPAKQEVTNSFIKKIEDLKAAGYQVLLSVCRQEERKGIDQIIKALPFVWQKRPKVAFVSVGQGSYLDTLKKMAKKVDKFVENRQRIIFTSLQSDQEIKRFYELCDIFILTPRNIKGMVEGFGIVYIEAGLFGKPVIGSKITGIPEAIKGLYDKNYDEATGLLIDNPLNEKEIAKKILMLVKDQGLAKKLGANNKIWSKKFSYQAGAEKLQKSL